MRLRVRIVSLTAVAVIAIGVAACAPAAERDTPRPAAKQAATAATRLPAALAPARPPAASARPHPPASPVIQVTGAPGKVKAKGAILADAATGQVLWSRDPTQPRPMASVTKVMTALLVLESGHLGEKIRVPKAAFKYAWKYGGETAGLHPGDVLTTRELLAALLLPSGADAAYTLAAAFGPGLERVPGPDERDRHPAGPAANPLHLTGRAALPDRKIDLLHAVRPGPAGPGRDALPGVPLHRGPGGSTTCAKGPGHHQYWWDNTNALIGSYPGAVGIKDGYTDTAGHCLLFEAVRHGRALIGVVLGSPASRRSGRRPGGREDAELGLPAPSRRLTGPAKSTASPHELINGILQTPRPEPGTTPAT